MKVFSTFTGIGGFEVGMRQSGDIELVGYSEIDKFASLVLARHFKGVKNYGDITKINAKEIPEFDILVGGFPCQAFSIAGKRKGFEDTRGTLFFDLARLLKEKRPRYFIFENVKGLLSHDDGRTFKTIIATLTELGYDLQWQVINSKYFTPQNRERIYIVGSLRTVARPEVFPLIRDTKQTAVKTGIKRIVGGSQGNRIYDPSGISATIASQAGGLGAKTGLYKVGERVRRLTPVECERLQGFPDNWTKYDVNDKEQSDNQRYKQLGNAITTNVVAEIYKRILETI